MMALFVFCLVIGIIAGIVGIVGIFVFCLDKDDDTFKTMFCCGLIAVGVALAVTNGIYISEANEEYTQLVYEVYSLDDSGDFRISIGKDDSKTYYFYRYKETYGFSVGKQKIDEVNLYRTDEIIPSLYKVKERGQRKHYYNLYIPSTAIVTAF